MKHRTQNRILSFFLALVMLCTNAPFPVNSVEAGESVAESTGSSGREYDYDTLKITLDGKETYTLGLLSHEKIEIQADGLTENADYQWQVQHPENDDVWVNIYDGTQKNISVTAALVGNVLRPDGTAKLRCRAYTEDYAYLTNPVTVRMLTQQVVSIPAATYAATPTADGTTDGTTEETPEFVTITIEYWRYDYIKNDEGKYVLDTENPTPAFSSYIATIQYGSDFTTTVTVPTIVGYDAYEGDATQSTKSVSLNYAALKENVTIQVNYKPAKVNYSVRYYFQNIYDDNYVEDTSAMRNLEGETGSAPDAAVVKKEFTGFTSMFYQPDTIAADGSTVFEVYYERNYYLMDFDCDGGYGADPVYVRYGTYISIPTPIKSGWVFNGWDLVKTEDPNNYENLGSPVKDENGNETGFYTGDGSENLLPLTMPAYNTAYKALWDTANTTYAVAYWIVNDDGTRSYIGNQILEGMSNQTVNGEDYSDVPIVCGELGHAHIADCYNCGQDHTHHLTHTVDCYSNVQLVGKITNTSDLNAIKAADAADSDHDPSETYIYIINTDSDERLWAKMYYNGVYYNITVNERDPIRDADLTDIAYRDGSHMYGSYTEGTSGTYTAYKFKAKESCAQDICALTCQKHSHSDACKQDTRHLEYVADQTDKNITIEGDGSTVVNVYYKYKTFTIRYVYARKAKNSDTYQFATLTYNGVLESCQWNVCSSDNLPEVTDPNGETKRQSFDENNYTYYYIALTAKFGDDITDKWPDANVGDVGNYQWGSWAAENGTGYRNKYGDAHANIVGPYPTMSWDMLVENPAQLDDGTWLAQNMIAWWGSNQGIEKHAYHNYFEVLNNPSESISETDKPVEIDGKTYYKRSDNGKIYLLEKNYTFTAAHNQDTRVDPIFYNGFTCINDTTGTTNDMQASSQNFANNGMCSICGSDCEYCNNFFYDRTRYNLSFWNYDSNLTDGTGSNVAYGEPLAKYFTYNEILPDGTELLGANYLIAKQEHYPGTLEPGAYFFQDWYSTAECYEGTELDWETITMPASDMVVYAYWKPVERNVYFYELYTDVGTTNYWQPTDEAVTYPIVVPHGSLLGTTYNYTPNREGYTFVGWFYMDENGKKRFAPDSMEIKRDLHLFAEWQSGIDTTYEVKYVLDATATVNGTTYPAGYEIAALTDGHSTAGKTKTFSAKGDTDLLPNFRVGFFPTVGSHSILMDADSGNNTYTFTYVHDDEVLYKVQYLDYATKLPVPGLNEKTVSTDHAVVTERFAPVMGYVPMPGYYYQTKSLTVDYDATEPIDANVITFYYMKDADHGAYSIEYYVEDETGSEEYDNKHYRQHTSFQNTADLYVTDENGDFVVDDGGNKIPVTINSGSLAAGDEFEILSIDGYEYKFSLVINYDEKGEESTMVKDDVGEVSGELSANGLTIKLYYELLPYDYKILFVQSGTQTETILGYGKITENADGTLSYSYVLNDENASVPVASAPFGDKVTYTAPESFELNGQTYEFYIADATAEQRTGSMTIRSNAGSNILRFYYTLKQYTVQYKAVCSIPGLKDFGHASPTSQTVTIPDELSATATAYTGYRFVGWYRDEDCKNKIEETDWVNDTVLTPKTLTEDTTYYALFEPITSKLVIEKAGSNIDPNSNFLFRIVGNDKNNNHIDLIVSIQGAGSAVLADMPIGEYTVTELTGWSWEYSLDAATATFEDGGTYSVDSEKVVTFKVVQSDNDDKDENVITFTNTYANSDWLGDETSQDNDFDTYVVPET